MVYRGRVENRAIRLKEVPALPEGAEVEVRLLAEETPEGEGEERKIPSLYQALEECGGDGGRTSARSRGES